MKNAEKITIISNKETINLNVRTILYVIINGNIASVHCFSSKVYTTRITLAELEKLLGENFIKVKRNCLVSAYAIHNITDKINLCNGEELDYAKRNKAEISEQFKQKQKQIINNFSEQGVPKTYEQYREYYRVFDNMPFAFTDIELVFDENLRSVDWVFRYGNKALEKLENISLEKMINHSFATLFPNMDSKWLRTYEQAILFEEMLNIIDYSPEINKNLEIICFPTFKGHCGCILVDIENIKFFRNPSPTENAINNFITKLLGQ